MNTQTTWTWMRRLSEPDPGNPSLVSAVDPVEDPAAAVWLNSHYLSQAAALEEAMNFFNCTSPDWLPEELLLCKVTTEVVGLPDQNQLELPL